VLGRGGLGQALDLWLQGVGGHEVPVGGSGDDEPRRHGQARPQQFAQVGTFATDQGPIVLAEVSQPGNQSHAAIRCLQDRSGIELLYGRRCSAVWQRVAGSIPPALGPRFSSPALAVLLYGAVSSPNASIRMLKDGNFR